MDVKILYKDKYLVAVDKPAGLNTEPDSHANPNLVDKLKEQLSCQHIIKFGPAVIHRLDRPVGGIVVFALTPMALKKMNALFAERKVKKIYQALVMGQPQNQIQKIQHYLFKDTINKKAIISIKAKKDFVPVSLTYKVLEKIDENCKLEIELHSGKYHQIRAQLSAIGHPIVGDTLYGGNKINIENKIMLHASLLSFMHPITLQRIQIESLPSF